jgi:hypothetical protein
MAQASVHPCPAYQCRTLLESGRCRQRERKDRGRCAVGLAAVQAKQALVPYYPWLTLSCTRVHSSCQAAWKRNKKVAIKHGFEGAWERILAWHGLRVCASASPLGGQCHCASPRASVKAEAEREVRSVSGVTRVINNDANTRDAAHSWRLGPHVLKTEGCPSPQDALGWERSRASSRKGYMHRMAVREAGVSGKGDAIQSADRSINTSGFAYGTWHVQKRMRP